MCSVGPVPAFAAVELASSCVENAASPPQPEITLPNGWRLPDEEKPEDSSEREEVEVIFDEFLHGFEDG
jgi:hypothetical protein